MRNLTLVILLAATGCIAPRLQTRSGAPEVTVPNVSIDKIKSAFASSLADDQWEVLGIDSFSMVCEKDAGMGASIFFGSRFNPTVKARIRLTFLQIDDGVRVLYRGYLVSNPGSRFEIADEVWGDWENRQNWLERVAADLHPPQYAPLPPPQ